MNLKQMKFWKTTVQKDLPELINNESSFEEINQMETANKVVNWPISNEADMASITSEMPLSQAGRQRSRTGLMDDPSLKGFLESGHFGHGRYDGANCRTQEAMENGKQTIIAEFQNTVARMLEQSLRIANRLEDVKLETEGVCPRTTDRLKLAHTNQQREVATLQEQIELAEHCRGWVIEALNRYQQGFRLGLKTAVEFDLMTQWGQQ